MLNSMGEENYCFMDLLGSNMVVDFLGGESGCCKALVSDLVVNFLGGECCCCCKPLVSDMMVCLLGGVNCCCLKKCVLDMVGILGGNFCCFIGSWKSLELYSEEFMGCWDMESVLNMATKSMEENCCCFMVLLKGFFSSMKVFEEGCLVCSGTV